MKTVTMVLSATLLGLSIAAIMTGSLLFPEFLYFKQHLNMFYAFLGIGLGIIVFVYYITISKVWITEEVGLYTTGTSTSGRDMIYNIFLGTLVLGAFLAAMSLGGYYYPNVHCKKEQVQEAQEEQEDGINTILKTLPHSQG